jgi:hypothetical protein
MPLSTLYRPETPYAQLNLSFDEHRFHNRRYPPLYLLPTLTHVENGEERSKLENLLKSDNGLNLLAAHFQMTQEHLDDPEWQLTQSKNGWNLYTNRHNLPRIYAAPTVREVANEDEALQIVGDPSFSGWEEAIIFNPTVAEQKALERLSMNPFDTDSEVVFSGQYLSYENNRLVAEIVTDRPSMVVFSEMYDKGWQAAVNGETVPLWLVNYTFRGVLVEEGVSTITMEYRSHPYNLGLGVSVLTLFFILAIVANSYIRTSKHE